ncbi:MAG: tRNA dihydrouridine synthase DusB, partial [Petrimonas sp.]|nr:tRNA dihydrouridine synthase DusB [Petrimonas sp.]
MKIGKIEFASNYPVFLAPMEDVTDIGFRLLCKQFGADMVYTEFVSSDALIRDVKKTKEKLAIAEEERPVAIQIYGRDPDAMVEAARICEEAAPDVIDINFGCPVKRVAGKGAGSGMLRTPELMLEITEKVVKAVATPVTVKTRLGWDNDSKIIVPLAEQLQDCGIAALTIHGRTRAQMYTGEADWTLIGEVKNNPRMHIPIIGNGDIDSAETCKLRFDETGVDAVMIGRASFGRPWIFREVKHFLQTGDELPREPFVWYLDVLKQQVIQ